MEKREMVCINCPLGCMLTVTYDAERNVSVSGNTCPRGAEYGRTEVTDPRRIVTSTVRMKGENNQVLSVKTASPIPKGKIAECMQALKTVEVTLPVSIGDVVLPDVAGTGIAVIATKSMTAEKA